MLTTKPALWYGDAEDSAGWAGLATVTAGQADPLGGTGAYQVDDTSATVAQSVRINRTLLTKEQWFECVPLRAGTGAVTRVQLRDVTVGANRAAVDITWATPSLALVAGAGAFMLGIGGGNYLLFIWATAGIVLGNDNELQVLPAGATVANVGTVFFYPRNVAVAGLPFDPVKVGPRKAPSYEYVEYRSGLVDAWDPGDREMLQGELGFLPSWTPTYNPDIATPWHGANEHPMCNPSWLGLLRAAWNAEPLVLCPDLADCSGRNTAVTLLAPLPDEGADPPGTREGDGSYRLPLTLQALTPGAFRGY